MIIVFIKDKEGFLQEIIENRIYDIQIYLPKGNFEEVMQSLSVNPQKIQRGVGRQSIDTRFLPLDSPIFRALLNKVQGVPDFKEIQNVSESVGLNIEVEIVGEKSSETINKHGSYPNEEFSVWKRPRGVYEHRVFINEPDIVISKYFRL